MWSRSVSKPARRQACAVSRSQLMPGARSTIARVMSALLSVQLSVARRGRVVVVGLVEMVSLPRLLKRVYTEIDQFVVVKYIEKAAISHFANVPDGCYTAAPHMLLKRFPVVAC